jgi:glycosyltransferase involved in cell wall biosynthesis
MRVLLDSTFTRRAPLSGTGIYVRRLIDALSALDGVEVIEVANRRRQMPAGGGVGSVRNLAADAYWTAVELPRRAQAAGADLIHHPMPALAPHSRTPQAISVQDLAFERLPDHFERGYRTYVHHAHRYAARRAQAVICISETTAADVRELWGVPAERIVVAPLGRGQDLPSVAPGAGRRQHFLYVGDAEPRKNLPVLLSAYQLYRAASPGSALELVLAGSADAALAGDGVRAVHRPDRERLAELYAGAVALVHPSLYEGFGLTPLEAMSLGTPVLAARSPGIVEVCADAVLYADPHDPGAFATEMVRLGDDASLRASLAARGRERAATFSWSRCAMRHADAYSLAVRA